MTSTSETLADQIWRSFALQGALYAADAPIRQRLSVLAQYYSKQWQRDENGVRTELRTALEQDTRFTLTERGGDVHVVTSRLGTYHERDTFDSHSFKQRLHQPEHPLPIDDISVVVSTSRPAITTFEPVFISDYWQLQAAAVAARAADAERIIQPSEEAVSSEIAAATDVTPPAEVPVQAVAEVEVPIVSAEAGAVVEPTAAVAAVAPVAPVAVPVAVPVREKPAAAPVAAVIEERPTSWRTPIERNAVLSINEELAIDLRRPVSEIMAAHGSELAAVLADRLAQDPLRRIVSFGDAHFPENGIVSLGKNDLRKIRDLMMDRNEPVLDTEIISELYYHNPRQPDYEAFRFSLNYRLMREKDFEFVGVVGARVWATKGLPALGTKRVKAAEMGQITSFLQEGLDDSLADQSIEAITGSGSLVHLLTFFEWEYGVLPLDAALSTLLPKPLLPEQRSIVLRFDAPQHFTSYPVEVRHPSGNRGGWLQGLEGFFREHLVPGALITVSRGDAVNHFTITYELGSEVNERLLTLDEKKNRLGFSNLTFFCAVDEDYLPSQQRFGKLKNLKSFPMGERRKAEMLLEHCAETLGERVGPRDQPYYVVDGQDLFVGFNVLRPGSRALITSLLQANPAFEAEVGSVGRYRFTPQPSESPRSESEEQDEGEITPQPTRRRGRRSNDDE